MRRTRRSGGFFLCLLLNVLLNWEGVIRAGLAAQFQYSGACFIYGDAVNLPALLHAEHDCQFFLVP